MSQLVLSCTQVTKVTKWAWHKGSIVCSLIGKPQIPTSDIRDLFSTKKNPLGLVALKFECVQESLGELSIIWTPGFHPKTLDSLNGGGLGICIPQSTVLWICRPDSHPLSPALWTAVRSVHLQLPLYYRAERILRSQGRTWRRTTDCLK